MRALVVPLLLALSCAPAPLGPAARLESPSGVAVMPPSWLPEERWGPLAEAVDDYVALFEVLLDERVPRRGLVVTVVDGDHLPGDEEVRGRFDGERARALWGEEHVVSREVLVTWVRGTDGEPRAVNPLPALLHELLHDRQWRAGREVGHRFGDRERLVDEAGDTCDVRVEEAR